MAVSIFERKLELTDPESIRKLAQVMALDPPQKPLSEHPYSEADRERSRELLRQLLSRSDC